MNSMTFDEYQNGTRFTWNTSPQVLPSELELLNAVLGLAGEAGETADLIKKTVFHKVPMDRDKVLKELGDVMYYVARLADYYGFTLEEIAATNQQKLLARYPQGFVPGGGNR